MRRDAVGWARITRYGLRIQHIAANVAKTNSATLIFRGVSKSFIIIAMGILPNSV